MGGYGYFSGLLCLEQYYLVLHSIFKMSKNDNISSLGRYLYILTTVIVLLVTSFRPVMMSDLWSESDAPPALHQSSLQERQEDQPEPTVLDAAYEAILPIYKLQISFFYSFISEYQLIEEIILTIGSESPQPINRYFVILFRTFISPNAP